MDAPVIYASGGIPFSYRNMPAWNKKANSYVEESASGSWRCMLLWVKDTMGEMHSIGKEHATQYIHSYTGVCEPFNLAF